MKPKRLYAFLLESWLALLFLALPSFLQRLALSSSAVLREFLSLVMKQESDGGIPLDFGELTPVFWCLVFAGGLLIVTVTGISCVSCYLCIKRRLRNRRPTSSIQPPDDVLASFLLRPPPTNPDYAPTPRIPRSSTSSHSQNQHPPMEPSLPPADSAPPSYAEVVQVPSSYNQINVTESPASTIRDVILSTSHEVRLGAEVRPGPVEPSAPYPTLPHFVE